LKLGNTVIPCAVLEDGTRVLTQAEFMLALGRNPRPMGTRGVEFEHVPAILRGKALKPFIDQELLDSSRPVKFIPQQGGFALGFRAEILPKVCDVYLKARENSTLPHNQQHIARQAEILIRGLAHVGIIAMVDEATGFQDDRARDALAKILEAFVAKELRKWVRTFPLEYYRELCRLRGVPFPTESFKLPGYFGHLTNDLVYARLAPGVLKTLRDKNPTVSPGRRKHKHFQWLTEDVGDPHLREHLWSVVTLMKASDDWDQFHAMAERALPRYSELPLLVVIEETGDRL